MFQRTKGTYELWQVVRWLWFLWMLVIVVAVIVAFRVNSPAPEELDVQHIMLAAQPGDLPADLNPTDIEHPLSVIQVFVPLFSNVGYTVPDVGPNDTLVQVFVPLGSTIHMDAPNAVDPSGTIPPSSGDSLLSGLWGDFQQGWDSLWVDFSNELTQWVNGLSDLWSDFVSALEPDAGDPGAVAAELGTLTP